MKKFLLTGLGLALALCLSAGAAHAAKYTLKLAHAQPEGEFSYHIAALNFKNKIEKLTNGEVEVTIYPGGQLGTDFNVIKKVQGGGVDLEIVAIQLLGAYYAPVDVYSLPFLFPDFDSFIRVRNSEFHKNLMADMESKTNLKTLSLVGFSFRHFTNSKRPINSPADMVGLKMRMNQNKVQLASCEALGASAITLPAAELFSALQQGVVDGQDATLNFASSQKYYEIQKHMALTFHQLSGSCMIMNARTFASLPADIQTAVLQAAAEQEVDWQKECREAEDSLVDIWKSNGVQVTTPDLKPFIDAVMPVYEEFADSFGGMDAIRAVQAIVQNKN